MNVTCPSCGVRGRIPDESFGRSIRCPQCQGQFQGWPDPEPEPDSGPILEPSLPDRPGASTIRSRKPAVLLEDGSDELRSRAQPPEPWYYGFLVGYAKLWFYIGIIQFGMVFAATVCAGLASLARGPGGMNGAHLVAGLVPLVFSGLVLAGMLLVAAPILLLVDAARNLRVLRYRTKP